MRKKEIKMNENANESVCQNSTYGSEKSGHQNDTKDNEQM